MTDNRIGFGGNIDGVLRPETKPDVSKRDLISVPIPERKPNSNTERKEIEERLEENIKIQKKLLDFVRKGMKTGPAFIYELNKKTQEVMHERNNGPI